MSVMANHHKEIVGCVFLFTLGFFAIVFNKYLSKKAIQDRMDFFGRKYGKETERMTRFLYVFIGSVLVCASIIYFLNLL